MDFEKIMEGLTRELETALKEMAKVKSADEKLQHSRIVKNLCESMGIFLDFARDMSENDFEE